MANNTWSNYTEKTATPVDADEVMARDSTDGKNKRLLFGTFWKWVAKKLNEATISELQTSNKTIIGAINALNSDSGKMYVAYNNSDLNKLYDLNQIQSARIYVCVPGTHNIPEQETGFLIVIKYDNNSKMQIYMSLTKNIYIRNSNSEWTKL